MIHLMSDTSTLYNIKEGKEIGVDIIPLHINIDQKSYQEYEEIQPNELIQLIQEGKIPSTSQPSIGQKMAIYDQYDDSEIIDLTLCDGLSGTYQSSCSAKQESKNNERIHVVNTKTLCIPHRYLVQKAARLIQEGKPVQEILASLDESIANSYSFLIPSDFSFLKRGGRLTPLAATVGGLLKIVPILTQTEDRLKLEKFATKRTYKSAIDTIIQFMKEHQVNEDWIIGVAHASCLDKANETIDLLHQASYTDIQLHDLSCAFISQGGPGCIAIQMIKK